MTDRTRDIPIIPPPVPKPATFDIHAIGHDLFGPRWPEPLAHFLGVNVRTVMRWANGQNEVPPGLQVRIEEARAYAHRCRQAAATDRARRAAEAAEPDWDATGRDIADRYSSALGKLSK